MPLTHHSQRARAPGPSSNRNAANVKNDDTTKSIVYSVSVTFSVFRVQQYTGTTAIGNNINIHNQYKGPGLNCLASNEKFVAKTAGGFQFPFQVWFVAWPHTVRPFFLVFT